MTGRIAVGVSGAGTSLQALVAASQRGALGAEVALVFADRDCPGARVGGGGGDRDRARAGPRRGRPRPPRRPTRRSPMTLVAVAPDLVVLAGYMRVLGPRVLDAFRGRIVNLHAALLPAFPGAHPVRDALAAGVRVSGTTVHLVDATLDGGPILAQQRGAGPAGRRRGRAPRTDQGAWSTCCCRRSSRRCSPTPRGAARPPRPRRALLSVSDKAGLVELARGLAALGFELVSTGGTARALREAGLRVTDVAAVTGAPEMLDGRVKTLHPAIHGGLLADLRRADHAAQLRDAGSRRSSSSSCNLYPFEAAAARPDIAFDELIEEIDIGGPTLVRAAAKNHASVACVTRPGAVRRRARRASRDRAQVGEETRRPPGARGVRADRRATTRRSPPSSARGWPADRDAGRSRLEQVEQLRYGENPHQRAALYRLHGTDPAAGPFATGSARLQGKPLSYNNILDASAAAGDRARPARHRRA